METPPVLGTHLFTFIIGLSPQFRRNLAHMQIILIAILQTILPPSLKKFPLTQTESSHRMGKSQAVLCVCMSGNANIDTLSIT